MTVNPKFNVNDIVYSNVNGSLYRVTGCYAIDSQKSAPDIQYTIEGLIDQQHRWVIPEGELTRAVPVYVENSVLSESPLTETARSTALSVAALLRQIADRRGLAQGGEQSPNIAECIDAARSLEALVTITPVDPEEMAREFQDDLSRQGSGWITFSAVDQGGKDEMIAAIHRCLIARGIPVTPIKARSSR